jgi:hypothetical protein
MGRVCAFRRRDVQRTVDQPFAKSVLLRKSVN